MANPRKPRKGSMGVWPRKRAKKSYARIRGWSSEKTEKPQVLGFAGYKVGMTHVIGLDIKKTSMTKNEEIRLPVTILECPPMRVHSARFYKKDAYGSRVALEIAFKPSKELSRKLDSAKKSKETDLSKVNVEEYSDITVVCYTQPVYAGIHKKTPEVFELKMSGTNADKLEFIKAHQDKDVALDTVFKEAQWVDVHAVTKGKGTQGPIKRFGIALKQHKTEKGRRQPGSRGGWSAQQHVMYRTAYSGQTGFHQRMQHNLQVIKIGTKPEEINPADGFGRYGKVKSTYMLVKGSVPGAKKRMVLVTRAIRSPGKEIVLPNITHVSVQSKQGR